MAEGIVYLDVDDEITSAASRIRTAPGTKVALVVPFGSRIATSRMNFRLLSREALNSNRRLSIVSGDAAVRSLAASAGLPAFGSVGEYDSALAQPRTDDAERDGGRAGGVAASSTTGVAGLAASATVAAAGPLAAADAGSTEIAADSTGSMSASVAPGRKSQRPKRPIPEQTVLIPTVMAAGAPGAGAVGAGAVASGPAPPSTRPFDRDRDVIREDPSATGVDSARGSGRTRAPLIAAIGLVGLAVMVLAVGGYLFLPSAAIVVTPRRDAIGPIELTVSADPTATQVDPVNGVVPAVRLEIPLVARKTFSTTGTHLEETSAKGSVTFTNYDTSSGISIPSGSIVSTEGGGRFRTGATAVLQPAAIIPFRPSSDSVSVTAVKPGEPGNVPANTIRVVPQGQDPVLLRVNNTDPTSGGTHTETPEVSKAEVDKAIGALQADLKTVFDDAIAGGAGAPAGATLFPGTAKLGPSTPDVDPKTVVGQTVATFDLGLTATGTVISVDPRPVRTIAETQLEGQVTKDHQLLTDSVVIDVGTGTVGEDDQVTFQATARATQVAIVDAVALRTLVKGKTAAEAKAALVPFGAATVTLWPNWVATVTDVDARLTVTIAGATGAGAPAPSGSSGPSASGLTPGPSSGARPSPSGSRNPGSPRASTTAP